MRQEMVGAEQRSALGRPIEILHVEDNAGDVKLTLRGLEEARIWSRVTVASDGQEAIDAIDGCVWCLRSGKKRSECRDYCPDLILLDLQLPKRTGIEVLGYLKSKPEVAPIPVFVLTSSRQQADRLRSMQLGATAYLTKPLHIPEFAVMFDALRTWISIVMVEDEGYA